MPNPLHLTLTVLNLEQRAEPFAGNIEGEHFSLRIEFFFTAAAQRFRTVPGAAVE